MGTVAWSISALFSWRTQPAPTPPTIQAFAGFTPSELWTLSRVPITHVELQRTCFWQCLGCGVDAPAPNRGMKDMSWEKASSIAREGGRIRREMGYSLFNPYFVNLNYRGDGVSWNPEDATNAGPRRGFWDIARLFRDEYGIQTGLTIPGWIATNGVATKNIRAFAADLHRSPSERAAMYLGYSVKLFSKWAVRDIDRFLAGALEFLFTASDSGIEQKYTASGERERASRIRSELGDAYRQDPSTFLSRPEVLDFRISAEGKVLPWLEWFVARNAETFFEGSAFVHNLIENFRVLNGHPAIYEFQYNQFTSDIPLRNRRYQPFFKLDFLHRMFKYCVAAAGLCEPSTAFPRYFYGIGRASADFGIKPDDNMVYDNIEHGDGFFTLTYADLAAPVNAPRELPGMRLMPIEKIDNVHSTISSDGRLRFYYAVNSDSLRRAYIGPELFRRCAQNSFYDQDVRKLFSILAGIADRNVFGG